MTYLRRQYVTQTNKQTHKQTHKHAHKETGQIDNRPYTAPLSLARSVIKLLLLDNTEIKKVHSCKYLGIYIDDELNWKVHIDHIFNNLIRFTGRSKLSSGWLKTIYYGFIHPHIYYMELKFMPIRLIHIWIN